MFSTWSVVIFILFVGLLWTIFFFIFCKLKHSMLGWQARFLSLSLLLISLFAGWCLVASSHQHFSLSLFLFKFWFLILGFEVLPLKFVYVCVVYVRGQQLQVCPISLDIMSCQKLWNIFLVKFRNTFLQYVMVHKL